MVGLRHGITSLCHDMAGLCRSMGRVVLWDDIVMALHGGRADRIGWPWEDRLGIAHWDRQTDVKEHGWVKPSRLV